MSAVTGVALSAVQRHLWNRRAGSAPTRAQVAALRLCGRLDDDRLAAAVDEVVGALDVLRVGFVERAGEPAMVPDGPRPAVVRTMLGGPELRCVELLRADRDRRPDPLRDPLVRFHLVRRAPDEVVLAIVADPLVLDLRSAYLVLGAVMQSYLGRFRAAQHPSIAEATAALGSAVTPTAARRAWWSRRLQGWYPAPAHAASAAAPARAAPDAVLTQTSRLRLDADRWSALTGISDSTGNNGWLAVIAVLAWWLRSRGGRGGAAVFAGPLDLRDYLGLGPVIGPLTDRILFEVDLDGVDGMTFRQLVHRVHAGLLDAVVHYVPYLELTAIGAAAAAPPPPHPDRRWDVAVHYCRLPPTSAYTRGEESLARHGLSVELFCESELAAGGVLAAPVDVHVAESGAGMALVVNFDHAVVAPAEVTALLARVDELIDAVIADPDTPLGRDS